MLLSCTLMIASNSSVSYDEMYLSVDRWMDELPCSEVHSPQGKYFSRVSWFHRQ